MNINKVYLTGRVKAAPYSLPGRHRLFVRFLMELPPERNRSRHAPGTVLVEAAGRNAHLLLQNVKADSSLTVEGRLRSGLVFNGDEKTEVMLVRLENFSLNSPLVDSRPAQDEQVLPLKVGEKAADKEGGTEAADSRGGKRRGRGNKSRSTRRPGSGNERRGSRGPDKRSERPANKSNSPTAKKQQSDAPTAKPEAAQKAPVDSAAKAETSNSAPVKANENKAPGQSEVAVTKPVTDVASPAPAAEPSVPKLPEIKPAGGEALKSDMPF